MGIEHGIIEQRVFIQATPARVWEAFADREQFEQWFGVKLSGTMTEGATISMGSRQCEGSNEDGSYPFTITSMQPERELAWMWTPGRRMPGRDYENSPKTTVTITLAPHVDGTMVTVVESGFDQFDEEWMNAILCDNINGWVHQMKSLLEHCA